MKDSFLQHFQNAQIQYEKVGRNTIAYRKFGSGPVLLMVHGWPLSGVTYRYLIPTLEKHFTCIVPDSPGLGETLWEDTSDLKFPVQANTFKLFMQQLMIGKYHILAHDTGATIARILASKQPKAVLSMVILNTEIMNQRPSPVPLYQTLFKLPGSSWVFKQLLKSKVYVKSPLGLAGCFYDKALINDEFQHLYLDPIIKDKQRLNGVLSYLDAIDWDLVDSLDEIHKKIVAPIQFIWGTKDPFFPIEDARNLIGLSPKCNGMVEIEDAALMVYEEKPEDVLDAALAFWKQQGFLNANTHEESILKEAVQV